MKHFGLTAGVAQAPGFFVPGFGIWKRMLRSDSSICSSFLYCALLPEALQHRAEPHGLQRSGFPKARPSGMTSSTSSPSCPTPIPDFSKDASSLVE